MLDFRKNKVFEHLPDTIMAIRKEYNLDKPGMIEDAIRILREWVDKQQHFRKKDFSNAYLETTIITCKGSIERAKTQLDRMCTFRTLLPYFFGPFNVKTDFGIFFEVAYPIILPKLTKDCYRVLILKLTKNVHLLKDYLRFYRYIFIFGEFLKRYEYCCGYYIMLDFTEINLIDALAILNPVQLKQFIYICIEGYGMRIKGIHIFTTSKLIDTFTAILKQVLSTKVASRIHTHKSLESFPDIIPLDILPQEYGGKERPMKELLEICLDVVSSKEHIDHLKEMNHATVDESCRLTEEFNENYGGMPGSFKMLNLD